MSNYNVIQIVTLRNNLLRNRLQSFAVVRLGTKCNAIFPYSALKVSLSERIHHLAPVLSAAPLFASPTKPPCITMGFCTLRECIAQTIAPFSAGGDAA